MRRTSSLTLPMPAMASTSCWVIFGLLMAAAAIILLVSRTRIIRISFVPFTAAFNRCGKVIFAAWS